VSLTVRPKIRATRRMGESEKRGGKLKKKIVRKFSPPALVSASRLLFGQKNDTVLYQRQLVSPLIIMNKK
jgi:hypothetical protein